MPKKTQRRPGWEMVLHIWHRWGHTDSCRKGEICVWIPHQGPGAGAGWVVGHPTFLDPTQRAFKNREFKNMLLGNKGAELGFHVRRWCSSSRVCGPCLASSIGGKVGRKVSTLQRGNSGSSTTPPSWHNICCPKPRAGSWDRSGR